MASSALMLFRRQVGTVLTFLKFRKQLLTHGHHRKLEASTHELKFIVRRALASPEPSA